MEAPDNIFLAFEHGFVAQASTSKKDANGNSIFLSEYNPIEYIRKDALLEWAKEKKKQLLEQESENDEPSDVAAGINAGLDMLIGKLKSM